MYIVIIDNDKALLRSLEILLFTGGHHVRTFDNPVDACSCLETGFKPDVLIVDYLMPEMTGEEFVRRVRTFLPRNCRVYMISGHTDLIEPLDLKALGVDRYLPKPLDFDELKRLLVNGETVV